MASQNSSDLQSDNDRDSDQTKQQYVDRPRRPIALYFLIPALFFFGLIILNRDLLWIQYERYQLTQGDLKAQILAIRRLSTRGPKGLRHIYEVFEDKLTIDWDLKDELVNYYERHYNDYEVIFFVLDRPYSRNPVFEELRDNFIRQILGSPFNSVFENLKFGEKEVQLDIDEQQREALLTSVSKLLDRVSKEKRSKYQALIWQFQCHTKTELKSLLARQSDNASSSLRPLAQELEAKALIHAITQIDAKQLRSSPPSAPTARRITKRNPSRQANLLYKMFSDPLALAHFTEIGAQLLADSSPYSRAEIEQIALNSLFLDCHKLEVHFLGQLLYFMDPSKIIETLRLAQSQDKEIKFLLTLPRLDLITTLQHLREINPKLAQK